jgi:hypothetical protein
VGYPAEPSLPAAAATEQKLIKPDDQVHQPGAKVKGNSGQTSRLKLSTVAMPAAEDGIAIWTAARDQVIRATICWQTSAVVVKLAMRSGRRGRWR